MKVSVLIITYNHGPFIAQAIESVLMQRTSFDYEVVIGEDCSTDGTREIVRSYAEAHPDRIRPLLRERNVGGPANCRATMAACRGEYIAVLEGDDYWTSDRKLENQVALLERRPDSAGCFAKSIVIDDAGNVVSPDYFEYWGYQPKPEVRAGDIVPYGTSPANTVLFRRAIMARAPAWYKKFPTHCGLDLMITLNGPYLFLNETVGAYRLHPGSNWTARSSSYRIATDLQYLKTLYDDEFMRREYGPVIQRSIRHSLESLLEDKESGWGGAEAVQYYMKFLATPPWSRELIVMGAERFFRRFLNTARRRLRPPA
jgi:glycosyltransferase involved in cell wall biosynthesis